MDIEAIQEYEHPRQKITCSTCSILKLEFKSSVKKESLEPLLKKIIGMRSLYKPSYDDSLISPYKIWINEDLTETSIRTIKKHNVRLIKGKSEHSKNIVINTYGDIIAKDSKVLFKVFSEIIKDHEISLMHQSFCKFNLSHSTN